MSKPETINKRRWPQNPLEKKFVMKWREDNKFTTGSSDSHPCKMLQYLMSPEQPKMEEISHRDIVVAESVIQWLGSPVGQSFLVNVIKDEKHVLKLLELERRQCK